MASKLILCLLLLLDEDFSIRLLLPVQCDAIIHPLVLQLLFELRYKTPCHSEKDYTLHCYLYFTHLEAVLKHVFFLRRPTCWPVVACDPFISSPVKALAFLRLLDCICIFSWCIWWQIAQFLLSVDCKYSVIYIMFLLSCTYYFK